MSWGHFGNAFWLSPNPRPLDTPEFGEAQKKCPQSLRKHVKRVYVVHPRNLEGLKKVAKRTPDPGIWRGQKKCYQKVRKHVKMYTFGPPWNLDRLKMLTKKTPPRNLDRSKNRNLDRPKKDHRRIDPKGTQKRPGLLQGNSWPVQAFGPLLKPLLGLWQLLGSSSAIPSRPWINSQATPKSTSRSHIWHNYLTHICLPRIFNFY